MYIEEIPRNPDCTLKLSCQDPETNALLDFDAVLLTDPILKMKIDAFLAKRKLRHYIVVQNIIYDKKKIDFSSNTVESTLYMTLKTGKTYRWVRVGVSFIKIGSDNYATCIVSPNNASPYNRRDTFRIPVDCEGKVTWEDDTVSDRCIIKDISHDGIGISLKDSTRKLLRGLKGTITWEETAHFDSNDRLTTKRFTVIADIVRRKTTLDGDVVVGLRSKEEPEPIKDYIQWAQTHRGFTNNNNNNKKADPENPKGLKKQGNWELQKQLENMN